MSILMRFQCLATVLSCLTIRLYKGITISFDCYQKYFVCLANKLAVLFLQSKAPNSNY